MSSGPEIVLQDVVVERGGSVVLRGINLTIPHGAITAVIGASGAGKTTLLNVLNGGIVPRQGKVLISELGDLAATGVLKEHRRKAASIYQNYALIGRLSALDNVLLGLADQRHPLASFLPWPKSIQTRAAEVLDEVGLLAKSLTRVDHLSGGERQRVAIARALIREPKLIIADEPFASVDPAAADRFAVALRRVVEDHDVTAVIALHQIHIAMKIADFVVGIAAGEVIYRGDVAGVTAADLNRIFEAAGGTFNRPGYGPVLPAGGVWYRAAMGNGLN